MTRNYDVGVDIEQIRADYPLDSVAKIYFSPLEQLILKSAPANLKRRKFFTCWTRKEAVAKASGRGLLSSINRCTVMTPRESKQPLLAREETTQWYLTDLAVADGYAGALAIGTRDLELRYWDAGPLNTS
jgi:4'-phosphopantetheinyl transferase